MKTQQPWTSVTAALLLLAATACTSPHGPVDGVAVHVKSVRLDPETSAPVVLLEEDDGARRRLPIWIGYYEAQSIALGLDEDFQAPRPNTHDLIKNLVDGMKGRLERVVITELRNGTYFAVIDVQIDDRRVHIDSRPSDAIAVALRTGTPLFATDEVLRQAAGVGDGGPSVEIFEERERARSGADLRTH